ncbi:hypothetical protein EBZ39_00415 [bacterium]|nr:hypothetical protein [bacterium]
MFAPDLRVLTLYVSDDETVNGFGESVKLYTTLRQWADACEEFYKHFESGAFPANYKIFIPDFWHVAYGDAKCFPRSEADLLWNSTVAVRKLAEPFIELSEMVLRPHPGTLFHLKSGIDLQKSIPIPSSTE